MTLRNCDKILNKWNRETIGESRINRKGMYGKIFLQTLDGSATPRKACCAGAASFVLLELKCVDDLELMELLIQHWKKVTLRGTNAI